MTQLALVGRAAEMANVMRTAQVVTADQPRVVRVIGDSGMGKTTLLDAVVASLVEGGWLVGTTTAFQPEQDTSYGTLLALLDRLSTSIRAASAGATPASLARPLLVLEERLQQGRNEAPITVSDTMPAARALLRLLPRMLGRGRAGVALLVDDVQWADRASMLTLGYVLRHSRSVPLLVITAGRPGPDPLTSQLPGHFTQGAGVEVALQPLPTAAASQLLGDLPDPERDRVLTESGGNPFFLTELARHRTGQVPDQLLAAAGSTEAVPRFPATVVHSIRAELANRSEPAQQLARGAAIAGEPFRLTMAALATDVPERAALTAVDELVEAALLTPTGSAGVFRFRHPILAEVIHETMPPGQRIAGHRIVAEHLAERGAGTIRIARHLQHCGKVGAVADIDVLTQSAQQTMVLEPETSADLLQTAVELLDGNLLEREAGLRSMRAHALLRAGRLEESHVEAARAMTRVAADDAGSQAVVACTLALVERFIGEPEIGTRRLREALQQLPADRVGDQVMVLFLLYTTALNTGDEPVVAECEQRLLDIAAAATGIYQFGVTALLGYGDTQLGRCESATQRLADASTQLRELPADETPLTMDPLVFLASGEQALGDHGAALGHAEQGVALARAAGGTLTEFYHLLIVENAHTHLGRLGQADQATLESEQLARSTGQPALISGALARRTLVLALQGRVREAHENAAEATALLSLSNDASMRQVAVMSLAWAHLVLDEPAPSRNLLSELGSDLSVISPAFRPGCGELLTRVEVAAGRVESATAWAEKARADAEAWPRPFAVAAAQRASALAALADGDAEAAVQFAESAVAATSGIGPDDTRALLLLGRSLAAVGHSDEAAAALGRAHGQYRKMGAERLAAVAARELRSLGRATPSAARSSDADGLTAREREVAELASQGRTSREIGEELVISTRTVESHLNRAFRKLRVSSRGELIQALHRPDE